MNAAMRCITQKAATPPYDQAFVDHNEGDDSLHPHALACRLMACDWRSVVILGDPTVRLPRSP